MPKRVVQLGVGQDDALDRHVAHARGRGRGQPAELVADIGRGVEQEPALAVRADGGGGLAARHGALGIGARDTTGGAPAVPLGEAPAGGGTEQNDVHGLGKRLRGPLSRAPQISASP